MALTAYHLDRLLGLLEPGQAIASMGYPDIVFPQDALESRLGDRIRGLQYRTDSVAICKRHGLKQQPIPDAESLFDLFGVSLDVYDIVKERGCEIVLDLNEPYPEMSREQYDYVLDVGTLEHCFNVWQAAQNMAGLAKVGGRVFHENPFNCGNHGFYSFHPTWYHDFYSANGFEVEDCRLVSKALDMTEPIGTKRFVYTGDEVSLMTVAKRLEAKPFVAPTQTKYRKKT